MKFSSKSWPRPPLNIGAAVALWLRSHWGIVLFLVAVGSQLIIYTAFIKYFAFTSEHRRAIHGLLGTEALRFPNATRSSSRWP